MASTLQRSVRTPCVLGLCHELQGLKKKESSLKFHWQTTIANANHMQVHRCVSFQRGSNFWWQGYGRAAHNRHNRHELSCVQWIALSSFPSAAMWAKSEQVASQLWKVVKYRGNAWGARSPRAGCNGNICQRVSFFLRISPRLSSKTAVRICQDYFLPCPA